jgi:hypothetical protein
MRRKFASQKGASAVEFAIVLPVLIILLFGIIEFSLILYDKAMITNACREGARTGIVYRVYDKDNAPSTSDIGKKIPITDAIIQNIIRDAVWGYVGQANATSPATRLISFHGPKSMNLAITTLNIGTDPVLRLHVDYTYDFLLLPNFVADVIPLSLNLVSESTMRIEG